MIGGDRAGITPVADWLVSTVHVSRKGRRKTIIRAVQTYACSVVSGRLRDGCIAESAAYQFRFRSLSRAGCACLHCRGVILPAHTGTAARAPGLASRVGAFPYCQTGVSS